MSKRLNIHSKMQDVQSLTDFCTLVRRRLCSASMRLRLPSVMPNVVVISNAISSPSICCEMSPPTNPKQLLTNPGVDSVLRGNKEKLSSLESYLTTYKNNLVKESIRVTKRFTDPPFFFPSFPPPPSPGTFPQQSKRFPSIADPLGAKIESQIGHEDLGKFYESCGELVLAQEAFGRMRPDVSTRKHIVDVGKHLIRVAIQRKDWATALSNSSKILSATVNNDDIPLQGGGIIPELGAASSRNRQRKNPAFAAVTRFAEAQAPS